MYVCMYVCSISSSNAGVYRVGRLKGIIRRMHATQIDHSGFSVVANVCLFLIHSRATIAI